MVFSTLTFLFFFLPLILIAYYVLPNRTCRNAVLLIFSMVFYAWGEPKFILLMLATSFVAYLGGLAIHRLHIQGRPKFKKAVFITTVVLIVANLFICKYMNFVTENVSRFLGTELEFPQIVLPIGISFYTFQILSYVIDLYKGKIGLQRNYFYLTLYVVFFPQLIAGPIVRYETIEEEILNRRETMEEITLGLKRFIIGLAKKVILANNTGAIATLIYSGSKDVYGSHLYWLAAVAYALQIYFDFSGYSDMAIGLGQMFGFHFLENFNYPYTATSITDFWRRWHISLSSWFRDYIYIPMGGNRVKKSRWILNILVVWGLTGFWHGAQWNFLLWGLYYATLLLVEKLFLQKLLDRLPGFLRWMYTMVLVLIGWVLFNFTDSAQLAEALVHMFRFDCSGTLGAVIADVDILNAVFYIPLGIVCMLPWKKKFEGHSLPAVITNVGYLVLLGVCIVYILGSTYNPFIYFRF